MAHPADVGLAHCAEAELSVFSTIKLLFPASSAVDSFEDVQAVLFLN